MFEELGPKFRDLLELGRPGVVAALVAASQRLRSNQHEVFSYIRISIIRLSTCSFSISLLNVSRL